MHPGPSSLDEYVARAIEELRSPLDFVRWGASRFKEFGLHFGHGTDNAVDEALGLVLHALHLEPGVPEEVLTGRLTHSEKEAVTGLLKSRIETRKPAAYLTGEAWFAGLKFQVDERVLVPRSPIAEWIERGFEPLLVPDGVGRILDLGTGSGCIAVACAFAFPDALVDATDVSEAALEVARANVEAHGLEERLRLIHCDGFAAAEGPYDLIVSNPPYVPEASYRRLPEEYRFEPEGGLVAGPEGLDVIDRIIGEAAQFLRPDGLLLVEVGEAREAVERKHPQLPFLWLDFERGGDDVFALTGTQLGAGQRDGACPSA